MYTQDIITLYQEGYSLNKLKEKFNYSPEKIKSILRENNVHIRTRSEQISITNQLRGKKVNHNYFDIIDTTEKAWLLGFLAADGNIASNRNRIKMGLSAIDREILEKIKKILDSEKEILDYETNQGFGVSELSWSSANQKIKLAQYGIVPNKTYKEMHLPELKEKELLLSYILGYYDGDGCFRNDGKYCRIEICSYRPELLQDFADIIKEYFLIDKKPHKDKNRQNYYTLTYSTEDVIKIMNYCYQICPIYLQRKYNKYQKWLKENNRI